VKAFLLYAGPPSINDSVPVAFDTASKSWLGTYTIQPSDVGGQWSLIVRASDAPTPPNTGYASRIITVQNTTTGASTASFPLYYFGIIAALIAAALTVLFLVIRRRRPTQTSLKIDLGAVQSEAGRIESSDFFQSVRDQVKKRKTRNRTSLLFDRDNRSHYGLRDFDHLESIEETTIEKPKKFSTIPP